MCERGDSALAPDDDLGRISQNSSPYFIIYAT